MGAVAATVIDAPATGLAVGSKLLVTKTTIAGHWRIAAIETAVVLAARALLATATARASTMVVEHHTVLLDPDLSVPSIVLFGAGHVGRALATILGTLRCRVTWLDERPEQFPPAWPANVQAEATDDPEDTVDDAPAGAAFVVMTHSHRRDLSIVERVLRRSDFAYLGLIGSRAKRRRFEQRLAARGIDRGQLARLRCPIGLAGVPGKTPGAIAVAAAAELLAIMHGG
jgi:xanthine dehydrogenase accessory protein XdhC